MTSTFNTLYEEEIFKASTPEEGLERKKQYVKMQQDEWMRKFRSRSDVKKNSDGSYDVDGYLDIEWNFPFDRLPVKIRKVDGSYAIYSMFLRSLEDGPTEVSGGVFISGATELKNLVGAPSSVPHSTFQIMNCANLTSLEGCPSVVWSFVCTGCRKLMSLDGCPTIATDEFVAYNNGRRFTISEVRERCKVIKGRIAL